MAAKIDKDTVYVLSIIVVSIIAIAMLVSGPIAENPIFTGFAVEGGEGTLPVATNDSAGYWTYAADNLITDVAIADLNDDGLDDVVAILGSWYPGFAVSGDGSWLWNTTYEDVDVEEKGERLAVGDTNGDGIPEIYFGGEDLSCWIDAYNASGDFFAWYDVGSDMIITDLEIGDLDGDGFNDLVVSDSTSKLIAISGFYNNTTEELYPLWETTAAMGNNLVLGKINHNNGTDIIAIHQPTGGGGGGGDPSTTYAIDGETGNTLWEIDYNGKAVDVADVNGDGRADIIVYDKSNNVLSAISGNITGRCNGTRVPCSNYNDSFICSIQSGCSWDSHLPGCIGIPPECNTYTTELNCALSDGCSWLPEADVINEFLLWNYTIISEIADIVSGELDGTSGKEVAAITFNPTSTTTTYVLDQDGSLLWSKDITGTNDVGQDREIDLLAIGDVTGDGSNNLVVGSENGVVYVFNGDGTDAWSFAVDEPFINDIELGDLNGDGTLDVVAVAGDTIYGFTNISEDYVNLCVDYTANVTTTIDTSSLDLEITTTSDVICDSVAVTSYSATPNASVPGTAFGLPDLGVYIEVVLGNDTESALSWMVIKAYYTDDQVRAAGLQEASLKMYYFNSTSGQWQAEPNSGVNTTGNYVWANVTHASLFGVFGSPTPTTTGGGGTTTSAGGGSVAGALYTATSGLSIDIPSEIAFEPGTFDTKVVVHSTSTMDLKNVELKINSGLSSEYYTIEPAQVTVPAGNGAEFIIHWNILKPIDQLVEVKASAYGMSSKSKTIRLIVGAREPAAQCGNNICEAGENTQTCPSDCRAAATLPVTAIIAIVLIGVIAIYLIKNPNLLKGKKRR